MELPPGFRFHPTDEELITHYLSNKVLDPNFNAIAIEEVDLIKCEPWDLPWKAKMGEKEWYFFCVRDRKYPTGLRTNRATESGYWKATGKDKDIHRSGKKSLSLSLSLSLVGMKKTLVFYRGRAPKGEKTNWVMHEYRLEGKYSVYNLPRTEKNEWVICRVFKKSTSSGGKKGSSSGTMGLQVAGCSSNELEQRRMSLLLPPLMDVNPSKDKDKGIRSTESAEAEAAAAEAHVTCFSNIAVLGDQKGKGQEEESITVSPTLSLVADYFNTSSTTTPLFLSSASSISNYPNKSHHHHHHHHVSPSSLFISNMNISASLENSEQHYVHPNNVSLMQLLQSNVYVNGNIGNEQRSCKADKEMLSNISQETGITADMNPEISSVNNNNSNNEIVNAQEVPSTSTASLHLEDCLWSY